MYIPDMKPNIDIMSKAKLRAYVVAHSDAKEAKKTATKYIVSLGQFVN